MSKKLLSEAVVRRFAKLANLPVININEGGQDKGDQSKSRLDYEKNESLREDAFEDEAEMGVDAAAGELDGDAMGALDAEAGLEDEPAMDGEVEMEENGLTPDQAEDIASQLIGVIGDVLGVEIEQTPGAGEEMEMGAVEDDLAGLEDAEAGFEDAEAGFEDAEEEEEMDVELQEALQGINYVPGKKEIVNEVAKRVAKRLLKAKQAEKQLKEALGGGPRRSPRKTAKTTVTRQRTRSTRNARRRAKK